MTSQTNGAERDRAPVTAIGAADFVATIVALEAAAAAATPDDGGAHDALARYALAASFVGRFEDAARYARLLAGRAGGDAAVLARTELALGVRALFLGEHDEARTHLDRAGAEPAAYASAVAAECALYAGDDAGAEALALAAAEAADRDGDSLARAAALQIAGLAAARLGRAEDARQRLLAALDVAVRADDARTQLRALEAIGQLEGDPPGAAAAIRLLTAAGRHRRRLGLVRPRALEHRVSLRENELRYVLGDSAFEEGAHGPRLTNSKKPQRSHARQLRDSRRRAPPGVGQVSSEARGRDTVHRGDGPLAPRRQRTAPREGHRPQMTAPARLGVRLLPSGPFYGWYIAIACSVVMFVGAAVGYYGLAVYLKPLQQEHGWSNATVSGATSVYFIVSGVSGALFGPYIDRRGLRLMAPGFVLMAIAASAGRLRAAGVAALRRLRAARARRSACRRRSS